MKKALFLLLIGTFLFLISCNKDEPEKPTPPPPEPTLVISKPNPDYFYAVGGTSTIEYKTTNLDSLFIGNKKLPSLNGSTQVEVEVKESGSVEFTFTGYYTSVVDGGDKADISVVRQITKKAEIFTGYLPKPFLSLKATPDTIDWGSTSMIHVEVLIGAQNNADLPSFIGGSGDYETPVLTATTTYTFTCHNDAGDTSGTVTVYVRPLPLNIQLLCANAWLPDSIWYRYSEQDEWTYFPRSQSVQYGLIYSFCPNGIMYTYSFPDYQLYDSEGSPWYFVNNNTIFWPYGSKKIVFLTTDLFIYDVTIPGELPLYTRVKNIPVVIPD